MLSAAAGEAAPVVAVERLVPRGVVSRPLPVPAAPRLMGSVFDGQGAFAAGPVSVRALPRDLAMPAVLPAPSVVLVAPPEVPVAAPASEVNAPAPQPASAFNLQLPPEEPVAKPAAAAKGILEKAPRIDRLRRILGSDDLLLPAPPSSPQAFSAKLVERIGVEDAAAAGISQSYQLAAAESKQAYADAMTGVARAALLPQVKLNMKRGNETTSPGGDTYKYCKNADGCEVKDATGVPLKDAAGNAIKYAYKAVVPTSAVLAGGVVTPSDLTSDSMAFDSVRVPRRERTLTVTQSLFDYAAWSEVARQGKIKQSAEYSAQASRLKSVLDASSSYLRLFQYSLALRFAEDYERALQSLYDRIEERVAAGAGSQADQERVKGRRVNARSTVLDAKNALEVELTSFQKLTGFRPRKLALPPDWILPIPERVEGALEAASEFNPALLADLKQAEAIRTELHKVKGAFMPVVGMEFTNSLTRGTGGSRVPVTTSNGVDFDTDGNPIYSGQQLLYEKKIQSLMLTMNWSLFSGGQDVYQHIGTAERYNEAMFRLLDTRRELEDKLRASFESLATTALRTQEIAKETDANQQVVDAFTEQMFVANRSLLDVLDAHQKLYQSRLDYVRLLIAEANLAYDVMYNIGSLTEALKVPASAQSPRGLMGSLVGQDVWRK